MKASLRGRSLEVELCGDPEKVVAQLVKSGLDSKYVQGLAAAAQRYAEEETRQLTRQLVPASAWPGTVVCRRHQTTDASAWLMLKRGKNGWNLDSALFD